MMTEMIYANYLHGKAIWIQYMCTYESTYLVSFAFILVFKVPFWLIQSLGTVYHHITHINPKTRDNVILGFISFIKLFHFQIKKTQKDITSIISLYCWFIIIYWAQIQSESTPKKPTHFKKSFIQFNDCGNKLSLLPFFLKTNLSAFICLLMPNR